MSLMSFVLKFIFAWNGRLLAQSHFQWHQHLIRSRSFLMEAAQEWEAGQILSVPCYNIRNIIFV